MIKRVIMLTIAWVMFSYVSYGQMVVKGSNGEAIIDCLGLDPKNYTTTPKPRITTATNESLGRNEIDDVSSGTNNNKMYKRFEVSKTNDDDIGNVSWMEAIALCANKSGGLWRLPTIRELTLIMILKPELKLLGVNLDNYLGKKLKLFSATEYSYNLAMCIDMDNAYIERISKINNNKLRTRCIRDL